jgi:hypothetical protein
MTGRDGHFVDPHFGRLVRVHVMDTRSEAHHLPFVHGDNEMMPLVAKELRDERRIKSSQSLT